MSPEEKELFTEFSKAVEAVETAVYEKNFYPAVLKGQEHNEKFAIKLSQTNEELRARLETFQVDLNGLKSLVNAYGIGMFLLLAANIILIIVYCR